MISWHNGSKTIAAGAGTVLQADQTLTTRKMRIWWTRVVELIILLILDS
jgi:hypothetical protein